MTYSIQFIGKMVDVIIDRKINTRHPKFKNTFYTCNYGYVPNTTAPDGEGIDVYVLGVNDAIDNFKGRCVAVIHRLDDEDDKLVVVPDGMDCTDKQIREMTDFQEKYFKSKIIRKGVKICHILT